LAPSLADPDRTAVLNALGPARLPVLLADSVVIDVTHHIHDFAGHFFRSGCITAMFMFLARPPSGATANAAINVAVTPICHQREFAVY
jgi:hypothetical protein